MKSYEYKKELDLVLKQKKMVRANYGAKILQFYNPKAKRLNTESKKFKELINNFYEENKALEEESLRLYHLMNKAITNKE